MSTKPKGKRPERELRNAILMLLRAHGIAAWPTGVGAFPSSYKGRQRFVRVGSKGMADIVGCIPWCPVHERAVTAAKCEWTAQHIGRFLAIEVKNPGGRVSTDQTAFLQTVTRAGGIGFIARSCQDLIDKLGLDSRGA